MRTSLGLNSTSSNAIVAMASVKVFAFTTKFYVANAKAQGNGFHVRADGRSLFPLKRYT